jgi:hypothetical protein
MAEEFGRQTVPPFLRRAREALGAEKDAPGSPAGESAPEAKTEPAPQPTQAVGRSVAAAGERIQEIIDAAENAAAGIRADAEAEAQEYLEQRRAEIDKTAAAQIERLETLLDNLRRELRAMERQGDAMVSAVEAAIVEARRPLEVPSSSGPEPAPVEQQAPVSEAPVSEKPTPAPEDSGPKLNPDAPRIAAAPAVAYAGTGQSDTESPAAISTEAPLIRATQMAVQGSDRSEIESTLKHEFGIEDAAPILDEILGR